jgi:predicted O-methyltransferase YrrM
LARNARFARDLVRADPYLWRLGFWHGTQLAREAKRRRAIQKIREFAPLLALVRRRRPRRIVEIGTAAGGSFYAWCRVAAANAVIVSIDLPGGSFGGGYSQDDLPRLQSYGLEGQQLSFILADSHCDSTVEKLSEALGGAGIDFLMIDGDHSYQGARRDFEMYTPLLSKNGIVAFHDIVLHPPERRCDVHRLWAEVRQRYRHLEFIDPHPDPVEGAWGGIGVIYAGE